MSPPDASSPAKRFSSLRFVRYKPGERTVESAATDVSSGAARRSDALVSDNAGPSRSVEPVQGGGAVPAVAPRVPPTAASAPKGPPKLKATGILVLRPPVTPPFDGRVAAQGFFSDKVVTSPNMDFVPEFPVERRVIETFDDGLWGVHEYSRWPQVLDPHMMHIACIPVQSTTPSVSGPAHSVLWRTLDPQTSWEEDEATGVKGLGFIIADLRDELVLAAEDVLDSLTTTTCLDQHVVDHCKFLKLVLRQALDRLQQLPARRGVAIAVAAHVQRLSLELLGMKTYMEVVLPRINSSADYSLLVLPVLGAFVREGTAAQTLTRVGLPTWFLQPITHQLRVWEIVEVRKVPQWFSRRESEPPIYHDPGRLAGVTNLTGNWLRTMAVSISEVICDLRLASLDDNRGQSSAASEPSAVKRRRIDGGLSSQHFVMAPPKQSRSGSQRRGIRKPGEGSAERGKAIRLARRAEHPSRVFRPPALYSVPNVWAEALAAVSPVPEPPASSVYFYAPPFLIDAVSSSEMLPEARGGQYSTTVDRKAPRYVHNLVRIRRFCRARLFDPSMSSQPLTIAEWRAALWGDYDPRTHPMKGDPSAELRRAQRRQDLRNGIGRLFGRVALLPSYNELIRPRLQDTEVSLHDATTNRDVQRLLLWEAHEINFRCELMALDTLLVQRSTWQILHRWERESTVSAVWGKRSSVLGVLPISGPKRAPLWACPPDAADAEAHASLCSFLELLTRWPQCPQCIVDGYVRSEGWTSSRFAELRRAAVKFYVDTFVKIYSRLPVPPIVVDLGETRDLR
ncbi:hypothetical protein OH77DRAFT_1588707 [Trametes cingulata]|nr:hypothetical protein OH77DRAFT_1588707 [Trametes cingulata]